MITAYLPSGTWCVHTTEGRACNAFGRGGVKTMRPLVALALAGSALLATAGSALAGSLPSVSSGHRPGPDVLYANPPSAPQLENAAPWTARPILVSGAASYRGGEFLYQDFLYDDHGAAGAQDPTDPLHAAQVLFSPENGTPAQPADPA